MIIFLALRSVGIVRNTHKFTPEIHMHTPNETYILLLKPHILPSFFLNSLIEKQNPLYVFTFPGFPKQMKPYSKPCTARGIEPIILC